METVIIEVNDKKAISILKGMEMAGLITLSQKDIRKKSLAKKLRGSITKERAEEMIRILNKEREEWEERY